MSELDFSWYLDFASQFCFAEAARKAGHPDWVQLLALL
jgi:hypothetical protein